MSKTSLFDLSGKVSLITGGGGGLGRVFCEAMAENGSDVVFSYHNNEAGARQTEDTIAKYGVKTLVVRADVSRPEDVRAMFRKVDQEFGKLDILFNNAGMSIRAARIHEIPLEDWSKLISTDLTGLFLCMQEGIKLMLRQRMGSIINIASIFGLRGLDSDISATTGAYCAAKHGVIGLTKQGAVEYGPDGIRVNAIVPGYYTGTRIGRRTGRSEEETQDLVKKLVKLIPMRRMGEPAELKGIAVYLGSDASSYVTGAIFVLDGGWSAW